MQRYRTPAQIYEKSITKGTKGVEQFNEILKYLISQIYKPNQTQSRIDDVTSTLDSIITYFLAQTKTYMLNELHRNNLVQCIQNFGFSLDQIGQVDKYYQPIMNTLLSFFTDGSERVRLSAIGGIYNLLNKYSQNAKQFFLLTFQRVSVLIADDSGQIRQAATFLNQALKTMVHNAVFDQIRENLKQFVKKLAQRLETGSNSAKQFMLDWLMTIEQIPQFQISYELPYFFRQVFSLLLSPNKSLKTKTEQCLKKFLHVFRETLALQGKLSSKLPNDAAQIVIEMILILIRQNQNSEIKFHALQWLELFTKFLSHEITNNLQKFLEPIYSLKLMEIIIIVVTMLSDESDKIRKISSRINELLLQIFPLVEIQKTTIDKASKLLETLLSESRVSLRVETILRWVKLLLQNHTERHPTQIHKLIELVVQKLCDRNATRNLFQLLEGSLFVQDYFNLLVQTLIFYLYHHRGIPPQPIFRQLLALSESQNHFIVLCKCVKQFEDNVYRYRLIESLIVVLVSQHSLQPLRNKLTTKVNCQLFIDLFVIFAKNQAATLILCFLAGKYHLARQFLQYLANQELLNDYKFRSLVKMSNLVEHSNMNHLRTDLRESATAVKAYLSLLMTLPFGKYSGLLLQRLPPQMPPLKQQQILQQQLWLTEKLVKQYKKMRQQQEGVMHYQQERGDQIK